MMSVSLSESVHEEKVAFCGNTCVNVSVSVSPVSASLHMLECSCNAAMLYKTCVDVRRVAEGLICHTTDKTRPVVLFVFCFSALI